MCIRDRGDFHARSRFARSTIPEEKWGLLVVYLYRKAIHYFRNGKATGAEMCPASVPGMVTGHAPVSYWLIVFLSLETVPEVFAKVNSS